MILFQTETSDEKCKSLLYTYDKYISKWWIIKKKTENIQTELYALFIHCLDVGECRQ